MKSHNNFNGTTCRTAVLEVHEPQASRIRRIEDSRTPESERFGRVDEVRISTVARRPISGLWTLNYTTNSSTEAMVKGNRYYWKVRGLDGGGEQ